MTTFLPYINVIRTDVNEQIFLTIQDIILRYAEQFMKQVIYIRFITFFKFKLNLNALQIATSIKMSFGDCLGWICVGWLQLLFESKWESGPVYQNSRDQIKIAEEFASTQYRKTSVWHSSVSINLLIIYLSVKF